MQRAAASGSPRSPPGCCGRSRGGVRLARGAPRRRGGQRRRRALRGRAAGPARRGRARGARPTRRAHAGGMRALREAGGRVVFVADPEPDFCGADLIMDGLLGIGGRAACAARSPNWPPRTPPRRSAERRSSPWTCRAGSTRTPARSPAAAVDADVTVTFGTHKPGLFLDPGAGRTRGHRVRRHRPRARPGRAGAGEPAGGGRAGAAARPRPFVTQIQPRSGRPRGAARNVPRRGAAGRRRRAALGRRRGALQRAGGRRAPAHPEVITGEGKVQAWVVGSGLGQDDQARSSASRRAGLQGRPAGLWTPTASGCCRRRRSSLAKRTAHRSDPARGRGGRAARRGAARRSRPSGWSPSAALASCTDATVLLKGTLTR
jgi:hypothetical protein